MNDGRRPNLFFVDEIKIIAEILGQTKVLSLNILIFLSVMLKKLLCALRIIKKIKVEFTNCHSVLILANLRYRWPSSFPLRYIFRVGVFPKNCSLVQFTQAVDAQAPSIYVQCLRAIVEHRANKLQ